MKSFYTDGIGNQQTLTNSQDEKIPIYDTYSDAQSDLSNLEEGQIVGTKGAFNQMTLVDTIQSGNMNAVTSNAVANAGFLTSNDIVDEVTVNNMNSVTSNAVYNAIGGKNLKYKDITFTLADMSFTYLSQQGREYYYCNLPTSDYFASNQILLNACIIYWSGTPLLIVQFDANTEKLSFQTNKGSFESDAYLTVRYLYLET